MQILISAFVALTSFVIGQVDGCIVVQQPLTTEIAVSVVTPPPEKCLNNAPFQATTTGWTCEFPVVGGLTAGDKLCYPNGRHNPPRCAVVTQRILDLVSKYFPLMEQRWAVFTAGCESEFDDHADNGVGYGGYFQHWKRGFSTRESAAVRYWAERGVSWLGRGVFDGESNTATSAYWASITDVDQQWQCSGKGWQA